MELPPLHLGTPAGRPRVAPELLGLHVPVVRPPAVQRRPDAVHQQVLVAARDPRRPAGVRDLDIHDLLPALKRPTATGRSRFGPPAQGERCEGAAS
ncbi:hypothetical protein AB0M95_20425 [Sphaerisporangium sp. NPDC051017]|uniref:hypothetical protein n=1 Tax=Sphaerisporangium sp. NPDC051017 TaxID=3154636 RepID=UPI003431A26B